MKIAFGVGSIVTGCEDNQVAVRWDNRFGWKNPCIGTIRVVGQTPSSHILCDDACIIKLNPIIETSWDRIGSSCCVISRHEFVNDDRSFADERSSGGNDDCNKSVCSIHKISCRVNRSPRRNRINKKGVDRPLSFSTLSVKPISASWSQSSALWPSGRRRWLRTSI